MPIDQLSLTVNMALQVVYAFMVLTLDSVFYRWETKTNPSLSYLSVEGDSTGLTFGADTLRPGGMLLAAWLYPAVQVLQTNKLAPAQQKIIISEVPIPQRDISFSSHLKMEGSYLSFYSQC